MSLRVQFALAQRGLDVAFDRFAELDRVTWVRTRSARHAAGPAVDVRLGQGELSGVADEQLPRLVRFDGWIQCIRLLHHRPPSRSC